MRVTLGVGGKRAMRAWCVWPPTGPIEPALEHTFLHNISFEKGLERF